MGIPELSPDYFGSLLREEDALSRYSNSLAKAQAKLCFLTVHFNDEHVVVRGAGGEFRTECCIHQVPLK